jgi:hypothetical protein
MIIVYRRELFDVIKAAIALKSHPDASIMCARERMDIRKIAEFSGEKVVMAGDIIKNVPSRVRSTLWQKMSTGFTGCVSTGSYIKYSLRHRSCAPDELVRLLSSYYPDMAQVISHKDCVSKKYFHMFRECMAENERLKAMTRLSPAGVPEGSLMYVEISPENDVGDLYMEWVAGRIEDRPTVVKCHKDYFLVNAHYRGYKKEITAISAEEAQKMVGKKADDNGIWETFYDSQFIENRRNPEYAKKKVPEKCSFLSEDLRKERLKIKRGIAKNTLDDFFQ